jgi:hypothetical protein
MAGEENSGNQGESLERKPALYVIAISLILWFSICCLPIVSFIVVSSLVSHLVFLSTFLQVILSSPTASHEKHDKHLTLRCQYNFLFFFCYRKGVKVLETESL